jgi:hypothetical protein
MGTDFSAVFTLRVDGPPVRSVVAWLNANDTPPFEYPPDVLIDNETEIALQPYPFTLINGLGLINGSLVFSSAGRASSTYDLFWLRWEGSQISQGQIIPLIVDPEVDLLSPAVSPRNGWLAYIAQERADRGAFTLPIS